MMIDNRTGADRSSTNEAARRMRPGLLGLVPEERIRALHVLQRRQTHGRREQESLEERRQSFAVVKTLLMVA